jgi:hypothetical protein
MQRLIDFPEAPVEQLEVREPLEEQQLYQVGLLEELALLEQVGFLEVKQSLIQRLSHQMRRVE